MKLADLLAEASNEELERLAHEHARADDGLSRPQLLSTIEGVLRSHRFLQDFLLNRQPPCFAILTLLLDAPEHSLPNGTFRSDVQDEVARLCAAIDSGEILARHEQLRVYRRVLYTARTNDLLLDTSESALLATLRHELEIAQVEHFLIEHHADLREFWQKDAAFVRELHALRSAGVVHVRDGVTLLPDDLADVIRRVLGIDMPRPAVRRLFGHLSNVELKDALAAVQAPTSGSKEERVERLICHMTQPRLVLRLRSTNVDRIREICRDVGASSSGSKEDLIDRLVNHIATGRDILKQPDPPPPIIEPRRLDEQRFGLLFARLRGYELVGLLGEFDLRRGGAKEAQVRTLWQSNRSEETLLGALSNADLEGLLKRLELKTSGSKGERAQRLIEHFASAPLEGLMKKQEPAVVGDEGYG